MRFFKLLRALSTQMWVIALLLCAGCASTNRFMTTWLSPIDWNGHSRLELDMEPDTFGRPFVPLTVNGHKVRAMIDSGAAFPLVSRALAMTVGSEIKGEMTINGRKRPKTSEIRLDLGPGSVNLILAGVDNAEENRLTAILGANITLQAVVEMDFNARRISIIRPDAFEPPTEAPMRVKFWQSLPTVQLAINGSDRKVCAIVDTGFNGGVALTADHIAALGLAQDASGRTVTLVSAFGETSAGAALAPLDDLRINDSHFQDIRVVQRSGSSQGDGCYNNLGMAVLGRHKVIFDLKNSRVWLLPQATSESRAPRDFDSQEVFAASPN